MYVRGKSYNIGIPAAVVQHRQQAPGEEHVHDGVLDEGDAVLEVADTADEEPRVAPHELEGLLPRGDASKLLERAPHALRLHEEGRGVHQDGVQDLLGRRAEHLYVCILLYIYIYIYIVI